MKESDVSKMSEWLAAPQNVVIVPHKNPDGDAIGSCTALFLLLQKMEHHVSIISPNDYPHFLKWLPAEEHILKYDRDPQTANALIQDASLIFTLDFNALSRIGEMAAALAESTAKFIMIDHHQEPEDYADMQYSDPSIGSTCEMVYNFIESLDHLALIDEAIANSLYTGIMTDTGSFRFPSTSSRTHRIVADLIDKGAHHSEIHNKIYDTNSIDKIQLLGCALQNLVYLAEYRTAFISLSREELQKHRFKKGDTEGFVNYGLSIEGVVFAVIFIEHEEEDYIKMSFRSKGDFSVNQFARKHFNGGGHDNAAGGRSDQNMHETIAHFKKLLPSYKHQLTTS